jgi:tubulin polyglutamylase TTLL9
MFAEDFKKKGGLWIMKPTSRCQGQGIFIIDKLAQVAPFRQKTQGTVSTPQNLKPILPSHKQKK